MSRIDEFTRNDILRGVDKKNKDRARQVPSVRYRGITEDYIVLMDARSATDPSTTYRVKIKLVDYPSIENEEDLDVRDKVRLAIAGDMKVNCSCPAFRYWGYEYITTQLGAHDGADQDIYPRVRNPKLEGVICKHLVKALNVFPMRYMSVVSDIQRGRFVRED